MNVYTQSIPIRSYPTNLQFNDQNTVDLARFMQYSYFPKDQSGKPYRVNFTCMTHYNMSYTFYTHELCVYDKHETLIWTTTLKISPSCRYFITIIGSTPFLLELLGHTFSSIQITKIDIPTKSVLRLRPTVKRRYNGTLVFVDNILHRRDSDLVAFGDCKASHVPLNTVYKGLVIAGYFQLDEEGLSRLFYSIHWRLGQIFMLDGMHIHQSEGIAKICVRHYMPQAEPYTFSLLHATGTMHNVVRHFPGFNLRMLTDDNAFFSVDFYPNLTATMSLHTYNMKYSIPRRIVDRHTYTAPFTYYYNPNLKNAPLGIISTDAFSAYTYPPSLYSSKYLWDIIDDSSTPLKLRTTTHSGIKIFGTYQVGSKERDFNYTHVSFPLDLYPTADKVGSTILITDFPKDSQNPAATFMFTIKGATHRITHTSVITVYNSLNSLLAKVAETSGPFDENDFLLVLERNDQLKQFSDEVAAILFNKVDEVEEISLKELFKENKAPVSTRDNSELVQKLFDRNHVKVSLKNISCEYQVLLLSLYTI